MRPLASLLLLPTPPSAKASSGDAEREAADSASPRAGESAPPGDAPGIPGDIGLALAAVKTTVAVRCADAMPAVPTVDF
jgi:hypothetical protein